MRPLTESRASTGSPASPPALAGSVPPSTHVLPPSVERDQPVNWFPAPPQYEPESLKPATSVLPNAVRVVSLCVKQDVPLAPLLLLTSLSEPVGAWCTSRRWLAPPRLGACAPFATTGSRAAPVGPPLPLTAACDAPAADPKITATAARAAAAAPSPNFVCRSRALIFVTSRLPRSNAELSLVGSPSRHSLDSCRAARNHALSSVPRAGGSRLLDLRMRSGPEPDSTIGYRTAADLVEPTGIEPVTSAMPWRRSPS